MLVTSLVVVPLVGAIICLVVSSESSKVIALFTSLITFSISIVLYIITDSGFISIDMITSLSSSLPHIIGSPTLLIVDSLNLWWVVLTTFLTPIMILSSWWNVQRNVNAFIIAQLVIESLLLVVFIASDILTLYVAFEAVLLPLFITVGLWGRITYTYT